MIFAGIKLRPIATTEIKAIVEVYLAWSLYRCEIGKGVDVILN